MRHNAFDAVKVLEAHRSPHAIINGSGECVDGAVAKYEEEEGSNNHRMTRGVASEARRALARFAGTYTGVVPSTCWL